MSEAQTTYGVSYIASAPEELKVGDRVEIIKNTQSRHEGDVGTITSILGNGLYRVGFGGYSDDYPWQCLRKLPDTSNPMDVQVGGNHYKKCKIEPAEYIHANGLDFFQGNIVKYITRFRDKDGKKDLEKIKHYCDMLIQLEYPE